MSAEPAVSFRGLLLRQRLPIALLVLCQAGQTGASLTLPSLSARVIDAGLADPSGQVVLRTGAVMLGAVLVQLVLAATAALIGARVAMQVGHDLRDALFCKVHALALAEIQVLGVPSLITRCTNDVQQLQSMLTLIFTMILMAPLMGIGGIAMAFHEDARLSALLLVSVPVLALVIGILLARSLPLYATMQGQIDRLNGILREQITGLRVIRAFVRDGSEQARFGGANEALTATARQSGRLMTLNMPAVLAVMQLSGVAVVWFAAPRLIAGTLQVGAQVAFLSYIAQIMFSVMMAAMLFAIAPRALVSARRLAEVLETKVSLVSRADPRPLPTGDLRLEVDAVSFRYPGAEADVLSDISFSIGPGEVVGIIGATGAGKSTLLNLIVRLRDVTAGKITLGGLDLRDLDPEALWQRIGLVPQAAYLFSGTLAETLRYGRAGATEADLWAALEIAQAADFVRALPEGLQSAVAQGGTNFSGGQRQRLAIARALVRGPGLYLFDDSFSALDFGTDARLRAALRASTGSAATLIVGQRVSSLRHADRILVMEGGRITAAGTHEELMKTSAAYTEIVASQTGIEVAA
jgi:ATP-binding cassette, subfamily B, multidrug efflux pump